MRFGGLWSRLGGVLEALESVLEAFYVVLEAMLGQGSPKQTHESESLEKHKESQRFLASHRSVLEASWWHLGRILGHLGVVLDVSWEKC